MMPTMQNADVDASKGVFLTEGAPSYYIVALRLISKTQIENKLGSSVWN